MHKTFRQLAELNSQTYIKGGYVRDSILGVSSRDIDFACVGDYDYLSDVVGQRFSWVVPSAPQHSTMLFKANGTTYELTVCDSIEGFGRKSDFTVNGMLLDIDNRLIDSVGGLADLANGYLKITRPTAIEDDPIRAVRGVRFMFNYNLRPTIETLAAINGMLPRIKLFDKSSISPFRTRTEFRKIMNSPHSKSILNYLNSNGLCVNKWLNPN